MSLSFGSENLVRMRRRETEIGNLKKNGKYYNDACEYVGFMLRLIVEQKAPKLITSRTLKVSYWNIVGAWSERRINRA